MSYSSHEVLDPVKSYFVEKTGEVLQWDSAARLVDFSYPWNDGIPPRTSFKALHDDDWLHLLYEAEDDNINVYVDKNEKLEVMPSDRVEIFFRTDSKLAPYYALEIDPLGRVMDYRATYHRNFDKSWSWPAEGLSVRAEVSAHGYRVQVAISKRSLSDLGLLRNHKLEAGIFRANCVKLVGSEASIKWISWIPPKSETPDFHVPSAFGSLILKV